MVGTFLIIFLILIIAFIGIGIWGIVAAAKTDHVQIQVGRLLLHLFLWGNFIAAIVYAVKCSNNASTHMLMMQQQQQQQNINNPVNSVNKQNNNY